MKVKVLPSRNNDTPIAMVDGTLCLSERGTPVPRVDDEVEVMISRVIYPQKPDGHYDFNHAKCLIVRSDLDRWKKVHYLGFETTGSMCTTTSSARMTDSQLYIYEITPGRVGVYQADNVNLKFMHGEFKLQPGFGWVDVAPPVRSGLYRRSNLPRLVGVESLDQLAVFSAPVFVPRWSEFHDLARVNITIDGTIHFGAYFVVKQLTFSCREPGTRVLRRNGFQGFVLLHGNEGHRSYVDHSVSITELLQRNHLSMG